MKKITLLLHLIAIICFCSVFSLTNAQLPLFSLDFGLSVGEQDESTAVPFDVPEIVWPVTENDTTDPGFYYDRWGNNIPRSIIYRQEGSQTLKGKKANLKAHQESAGYFELHYAENDVGFEESGSDGDDRRAVLKKVCEDISNLLPAPPIDPCTGQPARVHILINGGGPLPLNALGGATAAFDTRYGDNQILDGEVWKVLVTGRGSEEKIHHGFIDINFNFTYHLNPNTAPVGVDLYSVLLHEMLHAMGFHSMIAANGASQYQSIGRDFYSRFDLLMQQGGVDAISGDVALHDLSSNLTSATTVTGCNDIHFSPTNGCGFLSKDHGIYAPNPYERGSSLDHFDQCGDPGKDDYVMTYNLAPGVSRRSITAPELEALAEIGYQIVGGGNTTALGGVNDDFNCDGSSIYKIEACTGNTLNIPILDNDGAAPDDIVGIQVLGGSSGSAVWNGTHLVYTPGPNDFRFVVVQYIPKYGCLFGNVTEVLIYSYPCGEELCSSNGDPQCKTNCNGDFENADRSTNNCSRLGSITSGGLNVSYWGNMSTGDGSPDYFGFGNGNHGAGILPDEGLVHRFSFDAGKHYLIDLSVMYQGNCCEPCPAGVDNGSIEFLRLQALEGLYAPYGDRRYFDDAELHVSGLSGNKEVISDVPGGQVAFDNLTGIQLCFSPTEDYDNLLIYFKTTQKSWSWFLIFDHVFIREIPFALGDQTISCGGNPASVQLHDACDFDDILDFDWRNEDGTVLSTGLSTNFTASGLYSFNGLLPDGDVCFSEEFNVISSSDFQVSGSVTDITCQDPGKIDLTISGGNPSATYTYEWNTGATTDFLEVTSSGTYTVTVYDGNCFVQESFTVGGTNEVQLQIQPDVSVLDICEGNVYQLSSSESVDWYFNNEPIPVAIESSNYVANQSGVYRIGKENTQATCYLGDEIEVRIKLKPSLVVENIVGCEGASVTVVPLVNPVGGNFVWHTPSGTSTFMSPEGASTYSVDYELNGCVVSRDFEVLIHPQPSIQVEDMISCEGWLVNVTPSVNPAGGTYVWNTPSGGSTFSSPVGTNEYTVIYNLNGCETETNFTITVNPEPTLSISDFTACSGESVLLQAFGTPSGGVYTWPDGSTSQINSHDFVPQPGTNSYFVSYEVDGCATVEGFVIDIKPQPELDVSDIAVCGDDAVEIVANASPLGGVYTWPDGVSNQINSYPFIAAAGTNEYTVIYNLNGCETETDFTITVSPEPNLNVDNVVGCEGESVILRATGSPSGGDYIWPDGSMSKINSYTYVPPLGTGVYNMSYTVGGCATVAEFNIVMKEKPSVYAENPVSCTGKDITVGTITFPTGGSLNWHTPSGTDTFDSPVGVSEYSVDYTYAGCQASTIFSVEVSPVANNVIEQGTDCGSGHVIFGTEPVGGIYAGYQYQWQRFEAKVASFFPLRLVFGFVDIPGATNKNLNVTGSFVLGETNIYRRIVTSLHCPESVSNTVIIDELKQPSLPSWPKVESWKPDHKGKNIEGLDIVEDNKGSVYVLGTFTYGANLSGHILESSSGGSFVASYNNCGDLKWVIESPAKLDFESIYTETRSSGSIQVSNDGYVYLGGTFLSPEVSFKDATGRVVNTNNFSAVLKIDSETGSIVDYTDFDEGYSHVSTVAHYHEDKLFIATKVLSSQVQYKVLEFSKSTLTVRDEFDVITAGSGPSVYGLVLALDRGENLFLSGLSMGEVYINGETIDASGEAGTFVAKLNSGSYNLEASNYFPGSFQHRAFLSEFTTGEQVYLAGTMEGAAFELDAANEWRGYVVSLDPIELTINWAKLIPKDSSENIRFLVDVKSDFTGVYTSVLELGDTFYQGLITKFDTEGEQVVSFEDAYHIALATSLCTQPERNGLFNTAEPEIFWAGFMDETSIEFDRSVVENGPGRAMIVERITASGVSDLGSSNQTFPGVQSMTSVHEIATGRVIKGFPNPANEFFTIEGVEDFDYEVIDALGQLVLSNINTAKEGVEINVGSLSPGVYIVKVTVSNKEVGVLRFVKH